MNKSEFIEHIASLQNCTKVDAEKIINVFTSAVVTVIGECKGVNLAGFGSFAVSRRDARQGRNPKTGAAIKIEAYNQPSFRTGKGLKDACNGVK